MTAPSTLPLGLAPNWLGSPQHVVAGAVLALVVVVLAQRRGVSLFFAGALAVGATCAAEILVELVEYPLLYSDKFHPSAYHDTLADMASSLVGGLIGAGLGVMLMKRR